MSYVVNYGNTTFSPVRCDRRRRDDPVRRGPFNCYPGSTSDDGPSTAAIARTWTREYGKPVRIAEVTDGTSNTLMLSEVNMGQGLDARGFAYWGGGTGFVTLMGPNSSEADVMGEPGAIRPIFATSPCTTTIASPPSPLGRPARRIAAGTPAAASMPPCATARFAGTRTTSTSLSGKPWGPPAAINRSASTKEFSPLAV